MVAFVLHFENKQFKQTVDLISLSMGYAQARSQVLRFVGAKDIV